HIVRLIEVARRCGTATRAERHQELSVWTELEYLIASRGAWGRTKQCVGRGSLRARRIVLAVGDPHVAVAVDEDAVREEEQPCTKALHEVAQRIEFEDRREVRARARVCPAPFGDPDAAAVLVDLHGAGGSPLASGW